jgi:hypothetical protein
MGKAHQQQIGLDLPVAKRAIRALAKARAKPSFGNAGAVDSTVSRMQVREGAAGCLSEEDFEYPGDGPALRRADRIQRSERDDIRVAEHRPIFARSEQRSD